MHMYETPILYQIFRTTALQRCKVLSIENIHKVIDPLFLDDLKQELADIKATSVAKTKREQM